MPRQKSDHVDSAAGLARRLRAARERAGLSQRALARGICTPAYVSRLEKGERIPSLQLLRRLASRLGADADELASGLPPAPADPLLGAQLALELGETIEAEKLFTAALDTDDRSLHARALAGLGDIAYSIGDARGAVALLEEAGESHPRGREAVAATLGRARAQLGEVDAAVAVFQQALANARARGDSFEQLRYSVLLAEVFIDTGEHTRATSLLRGLVSDDAALDPITLARLWRAQSRLHAERGDPERSAQYAQRALEALAIADNARYTTRAHKLLARVELRDANAERALELLERASRIAERSGDAYEIATMRLEQARALAELQRRDDAAALALDAAEALRSAQPAESARGLAVVAELLESLGDPRAAEVSALANEAGDASRRAVPADS